MLRPENVGYAATCNLVGVRTGWNLAYVIVTSMEARGIMDLSQETDTDFISLNQFETFKTLKTYKQIFYRNDGSSYSSCWPLELCSL